MSGPAATPFVGETVRAFLEDGTLQWLDGLVAPDWHGGQPSACHPSSDPRRSHRQSHRRPRARLCASRRSSGSFRPTWWRNCIEASLDGSVRAPRGQRAGADPSDERLAVRHALIHDAAYAGLLASRRRALHARLADRFERPDLSTPARSLTASRRATSPVPCRCCARRRRAPWSVGAVAEAASYWRQAADLAAADDLSRRRSTVLRRRGVDALIRPRIVAPSVVGRKLALEEAVAEAYST